MRYILILFLFPLAFNLSAQPTLAREADQFMSDVSGRPIRPQQKYNVEGSMFFPESYSNATIISPTGKVYKNVKAKINLMDNVLMFMDSSKAEFEAIVPIQKIVFDFPAITFINPKPDSSKVLYQQLDSGKATLLKKITVTYNDQSSYGTGILTRVFEQKESYFIQVNSDLAPLDRSSKSVLKALSDKSNEIDAYIQKESLKPKKEEELVKIIHYYNRHK